MKSGLFLGSQISALYRFPRTVFTVCVILCNAFSFGCKLRLFSVLTAPQERACGLFCWMRPSLGHLVESAAVQFSVGFVTLCRKKAGVARVWKEWCRRHAVHLGQSCAGRGQQLTVKPVLYFPHEQSGHVHGQRVRGLLVFVLLKVYAGGPLSGCVPYMPSRSAWTVNKHVNKQFPRVIAHLAVFILFYRQIIPVRVATGFFTHTDVRAHPPMTIFTSRIP